MPAPPQLLLTRPAEASARFARLAETRLGPLRVTTSPLLEIRFLDAPLPDAAALIFTSENGVRAYLRLAGAEGRQAWCVGPRTAQAARAAGFRAEMLGGDAAALAEALTAKRPRGPLLYIRGVHSRGALAQRLNSAGIETFQAVLYDQEARDLDAAARALIAGPAPVLVPLFSPRSAALFSQAMQAPGTEAGAPLHLLCLSAAVAGALGGITPATLDVAARPDGDSLIEALAARIAASGLA